MATSLDTRAFTGTYPVELPTTGLLARFAEFTLTGSAFIGS